jgi:ADP-heptose:LPS heptosyltransferase
MEKTAVVIPSAGIGDALLMMIASHRLLQKGYRVITLHPLLSQLSDWFQGHYLQVMTDLADADLIVVQNDNSPKIAQLIGAYRSKLSVFYASYNSRKHAPLSAMDQVFDETQPMAQNIAQGIAQLLKSQEMSKNNGLSPPRYLVHRLCKDRVILHPTSSKSEKNWLPAKFLKVARQLKDLGFAPIFAVSKQERNQWLHVEKLGFDLPIFDTLSNLAAYVYESGYLIGNDSLIGHLASNLHIPTLIIADCEKRMKLWRPGWLQGAVVTPPTWVPNCKFCRLRKWKWKSLISSRRVISTFEDLSRSQ